MHRKKQSWDSIHETFNRNLARKLPPVKGKTNQDNNLLKLPGFFPTILYSRIKYRTQPQEYKEDNSLNPLSF